MIESGESYKAAVTADARRTLLRAVIDISDPDIVYGSVAASSKAAFSKDGQVHDHVFEIDTQYATMEPGRWLLNGRFDVFPDDYSVEAQTAFASGVLSGEDGSFSAAQYAEQRLSGVDILQVCSVFFSDRTEDGFPVDFTVEVRQGGTVYYSKSYEGNTARKVSITGFTVYNPDAIRVTVTKWSLPGRRMRVVEILAGLYEIWDQDMLASFSVAQQGDVTCVALPFGTCTLSMDNLDRRFEPRAKDGLFLSIEERQGIEVSIGVETEDGTEYKPVGVFYQYSGGWRESANGLSITWNLVDIVGLVADREFLPPATLPETLAGWVAAVVAHLGSNFKDRYTVDANYAGTAVTANSREDVTGLKCGDILRYACMAAGVWPRADAETGYLAAEPVWNQGNRLSIDNLSAYPVMKANDDIAAIIFTLADGNDTAYTIGGNSAASSKSVSIDNPFIHTAAQALSAARLILSGYGGNRLETTGRGDPSCEIGDVETVELDEYSAMSARRVYQTFVYSDGVLQGCQSTLVQADGSLEYQNRVLITADTTWTAPAGTTQLRIVLGGGGQGGERGTDGTWDSDGETGRAGSGGRIWYGTISIDGGQSFAVTIGKASEYGSEGGATTFGNYSSANGRVYSPSYTDIINGDVYGRTGAANPRAGTSDGGAGGVGGAQGRTHVETRRWRSYKDGVQTGEGEYKETVIDNYPQPAGEPPAGADGFALVYYDA